MADPGINQETGEYLQPGPCPINPNTGSRECPPAAEIDCLVAEKVFDQCVTEDIIYRSFPIYRDKGAPGGGEGADWHKVTSVECQVVSAECAVVDVSAPLEDNNSIVTVRQDVKLKIKLWGEHKGHPVLIGTFEETINDFFSQMLLYVPPPGALFGPAGGPFVFCEIVNFTCFGLPETVPPGAPVNNVIITVKLCKVIEVTAFVKLLVPVYGYCTPRPCVAAPQQIEIECPPIDSLFPPQRSPSSADNGNGGNNNGNAP